MQNQHLTLQVVQIEDIHVARVVFQGVSRDSWRLTWRQSSILLEKEMFVGNHVCFWECIWIFWILFFSQTSPVKHLLKLNGFSFRVICHHLNNHITTNLSNHQWQQWFWRIFCLVGVFVPIQKNICKRYTPAKCLESCSPPKNFRSQSYVSKTQKKTNRFMAPKNVTAFKDLKRTNVRK